MLAVLLILTFVDPDALTRFEITSDRTVLFYIGVLGAIVAICRGTIPEENLVFEPELLLREVIAHTHYYPEAWKGQLNTIEVK